MNTHANTDPGTCDDIGRRIAAVLYSERAAALARRAAHVPAHPDGHDAFYALQDAENQRYADAHEYHDAPAYEYRDCPLCHPRPDASVTR